MAKEFDIYLNKRLTQCDIIVYSIPYRGGLTPMNRLILEVCLENYALQKLIAVQSGSMFVSHIDEMIKTCIERLNNGVILDTSAEIQVHYSLPSQDYPLVLSAHQLSIMAAVCTSAQNTLQLAVSSADAYVKSPFGRGQSRIEFQSGVETTFKRAFEEVPSPVVLNFDPLRTKKQIFEHGESSAVMGAELKDLLYQMHDMTSIAIEIVNQPLETEIHLPFGRGVFPMVLDSHVLGEQMKKFAAMESVVEILSLAAGLLTQFMSPKPCELEIAAVAEAIVKRRRLLSEMDFDAVSVYDDMSLRDVDYIIS